MLVPGHWAELISGPGERAYVTRSPAGGQEVCSVQMTGNHTEAKQDKGSVTQNSSCTEVTASHPGKKKKKA